MRVGVHNGVLVAVLCCGFFSFLAKQGAVQILDSSLSFTPRAAIINHYDS